MGYETSINDVVMEFDEHPDVARLLQISFILMKAVKIIL